MSKKVKKKGLASGKRCRAFFLGEDFEATVHQIPRLVTEQLVDWQSRIETCQDTETRSPAPAPFSSQDGDLRLNRKSQVRYSIRVSSGLNARS